MTTTFLRDVDLLIRSRHPIIFVETQEIDRAQSLLLHIADQQKLPFMTWSRTKGLRMHFELATAKETCGPLEALSEVERQFRKALYNFQGLGEDLGDSTLATKLYDAAKQFLRLEGSIVITGYVPSELPAVIAPLSTVLSLPPPQAEEYRDLVEHLYRDLSKRAPIDLQLTHNELDQLVNNLSGLTLLEAEKILTKAMIEDNKLGPGDIRRVVDAKKDIIEKEGLLEYYPVEETLADIAGLDGLKTWLKQRRAFMQTPEKARDFGLEFPKGILLLGVQGAGKSLCAKAVANDWGLPLLKMDPASLYNKYIGESERNFRRAIAAAEKMAPVILWIDEIEKAFATAGEMDGGVSQRVLGLFLSWLQERKGDIFVVATANDVSKLPPELVRKGRFDELFFVDLPNEASRQGIFEIHLRKRGRDPSQFELGWLAQATEGFSGAEIEQVIVSGLYAAFSQGAELTTDILLQEIRQTRPLSVVMSERLASLRAWAKERTVSAN